MAALLLGQQITSRRDTATLVSASAATAAGSMAPGSSTATTSIVSASTSGSTGATGPRSLSFKLNGAVNALAASPDSGFVILAGRDVLRILQVGVEEVTEAYNLRTGRVNLTYSSNDVKWCPIPAHRNLIATAATNGAVVIWDLNNDSSNKQTRVIMEHQRAVNHVCFHPYNPVILLSASQDGTVKHWDLREPGNTASITFEGKAESVRDVQICPTEPNSFAAVFETGVIQRWDMRVPDKLEKRINAHSGPVFALDWHPEGRYLASGSRDKTIKIWDMKQSDPRKALVSTIQTIAPVGRIQWRPGHRNQLVSVALLTDRRIHLWDLRRTYVPEYTLDEHGDTTTGVLFRGPDVLWSGSKDQTFKQQTMADAYQQGRLQSSSAVSMSALGDLAFANVYQPQKVGRVGVDDGSDSSGFPNLFFGRKATPKAKAVTEVTDGRLVITPFKPNQAMGVIQTHTFDHTAFIYFAQHYKLTGDTPHALCAINSQVAENLQSWSPLSQTWKILQLLVLPDEEEDNNTKDKDTKGKNTGKMSRSISDALSAGSSSPNLLTTKSWDQSVASLISPNNDPISYPSDNLKITVETIKEEEEDDDEDDDDEDDAEFLQPVRSSSSTLRSDRSGKSLSRIITSSLKLHEAWDEKLLLQQTLEFYAEMGDVQTCVSILIVVKGAIEIEDSTQKLWFYSYIELLQRFKLWSVAAFITSLCPQIEVRAMTQESTTIYTSCSICFKPLLQQDNGYWACQKCNKLLGQCAICRQSVRGVYVWCEGCGHGGHMNHMLSWFQKWGVCAAGCGHLCTTLHGAAGPVAMGATPTATNTPTASTTATSSPQLQQQQQEPPQQQQTQEPQTATSAANVNPAPAAVPSRTQADAVDVALWTMRN